MLRLTSRLVAALGEIIGVRRRATGWTPATQDHDPAASHLEATNSVGSTPEYVLTVPLSRHPEGWSVCNCVSNRVVATDLTRKQALTLCSLLNFASHRSRNVQANAVH